MAVGVVCGTQKLQCPLTHDHVVADVLKDDAQRLQELHHQHRVVLLCQRPQEEGKHVVLHEVAADAQEEEENRTTVN